MNALILTETRRTPITESLNRHLRFLPGWDHVVVCSKDNQDMYDAKKVIVPPITPDRYYRDYNMLFTQAGFWSNFLQYDRVIVCHQDSGLLRPGIEEFLEWDYVGAPWKFQQHGGNGGLSLRNPKIMYEICVNNHYSAGMAYEDVWFCNIMYGKYDLAPRAVCEKFSVETIYQLGTLGYHNIEKYLTNREVQNIIGQYLKN